MQSGWTITYSAIGTYEEISEWIEAQMISLAVTHPTDEPRHVSLTYGKGQESNVVSARIQLGHKIINHSGIVGSIMVSWPDETADDILEKMRADFRGEYDE